MDPKPVQNSQEEQGGIAEDEEAEEAEVDMNCWGMGST
jgi:hypothetical protein